MIVALWEGARKPRLGGLSVSEAEVLRMAVIQEGLGVVMPLLDIAHKIAQVWFKLQMVIWNASKVISLRRSSVQSTSSMAFSESLQS